MQRIEATPAATVIFVLQQHNQGDSTDVEALAMPTGMWLMTLCETTFPQWTHLELLPLSC